MEQNFNYNNVAVRTITDKKEETLFSGVDVCKILDYQNVADTLEKKLDGDEKNLDYLTDISGQRRKTWIINEFGLYSLILTSSKPEAKAFKRWITHEVLPAIRKAGKYTSEQGKEHDITLQLIADKIQALRDEKEFHQKKVNTIKKEIESKTSEMISTIKMDKNQLKLDFTEK